MLSYKTIGLVTSLLERFVSVGAGGHFDCNAFGANFPLEMYRIRDIMYFCFQSIIRSFYYLCSNESPFNEEQ